jgi:hypothetical protein
MKPDCGAPAMGNTSHYFRLITSRQSLKRSAARPENGSHFNSSASCSGVVMIERRTEERIAVSLRVRVWGLDIAGERFEEEAVARNISKQLRPKDLLVVQYGENKACFRVVWTRASDDSQKNLAAVQRRETDECPWRELLTEQVSLKAR